MRTNQRFPRNTARVVLLGKIKGTETAKERKKEEEEKREFEDSDIKEDEWTHLAYDERAQQSGLFGHFVLRVLA